MKNLMRSIIFIVTVICLVNCQIKFLNDSDFMELNDYVLFINGFVNGTQLYKVSPNIAGCEVSDANLYTSIRDFYIYFNNNTWKTKEITVLVEDVTASFSYMFGNFSKIVGFCKVAPYDTIDLFKAFANYFSSPIKYLTTFTKNIINQPYTFFKQYIRSKILLEQGNAYSAGQIIGVLFKNIFFPELGLNNEIEKNIETTSLKIVEEFFDCDISNKVVIEKIKYSVREFTRVYIETRIFTDLNEQIKKDIGKKYYESVSICLKNSEKIAKIVLKKVYEKK